MSTPSTPPAVGAYVDPFPDEPSEDYYYCDEDGCEAALTGMDFVYGVCPACRRLNPTPEERES